VFERAALNAVKRWRYDPRMEDGRPVEWRTQVHIEFQLAE
jgi:outer membrane biosynthesis protein TonB